VMKWYVIAIYVERCCQYFRGNLRALTSLDSPGQGLGKTVQVCSYLGCLTAMRKIRSVLIVAPSTLLQHWLNELAIWSPGLRRVLIHQSGEGDGTSRTISAALLQSLDMWLRRSRSDKLHEAIDEEDRRAHPAHAFCGTGYVVITSYENIRRNVDIYTAHEWSYCILDEAQKIRNPDADITIACNRMRTPHRLALSGTPIQNDLRELWSLFDFVFPGRLGTLPAFEQEFADPIKRGGYSNASPMQVQMAYRCALMLKDMISAHLLRRQKREVDEVNRMPGKTEHVLFCRLTPRQRVMYEAFLQSDEVSRVLRGSGQMFAAVTMLRKICNHPDLVCGADEASFNSFLRNGHVRDVDLDADDDSDLEGLSEADETIQDRAGKLEVLSKILPLWHKQGHRVLIFCQWCKMLDIIQRFCSIKGWTFGRIDGKTSIPARQKLVDAFNVDESYFGLLCTTRTGGVGLNLTGANRIILYDPDWNPQTDAQARERAWRFGQEREVTVYRLITAGSIEEKIYQRQIFKTALSNKVLQDPRQRRLFSQRDLRDMFTLKGDTGSLRTGGDGLTETGQVTKGGGVIDPDDEPSEESVKDNWETIEHVMKSKGLCGVFDHNFVEQDSRSKSQTVKEMEEQAKRVAKEAAAALRQSVSMSAGAASYNTESRFGSSHGSVLGSGRAATRPTDAGDLLANLRQRTKAIDSNGAEGDTSIEAKQYAQLLQRIKEFIRKRRPSTDDLLKAFDDISSADVAIFRSLLKSVASVQSGRWYLNHA
jgi:DNA excision repair protein ERCC-6